MALGFSSAQAAAILNGFANATAYTGAANTWMALHVGDPGAAGTSNPATETTRHEVTWAPASGGTVANDAAVTWTNIAGSQDATHFSLWSLVAGGTFLGSGTITANAYSAGDTYNIAIGAATITVNTAA